MIICYHISETSNKEPHLSTCFLLCRATNSPDSLNLTPAEDAARSPMPNLRPASSLLPFCAYADEMKLAHFMRLKFALPGNVKNPYSPTLASPWGAPMVWRGFQAHLSHKRVKSPLQSSRLTYVDGGDYEKDNVLQD